MVPFSDDIRDKGGKVPTLRVYKFNRLQPVEKIHL